MKIYDGKKINVSQLNLMKTDASQILKTDLGQTTSFWRSIYIFQSNPLLQVYSFHFESRKKESKL